MTSSSDIQQLVDCFDDIPQMMASMNRGNKSIPSCCPEVSQSSSVDAALRGYNPIDVKDPTNQHRVNRMASQAIKVLEQLSKIPSDHNNNSYRLRTKSHHNNLNRPVQETSSLVKNKLNMLKDTGVDLSKFYAQYDVNRSGKVSYKDFTDTLLAVSAGVRREEALELATKLDKKKTGSIAYRSIVNSLQEIESSSLKSTNSLDTVTTTESVDSLERIQSIKPKTTFSYLNSKHNIKNNESNSWESAERRELIEYRSLSADVEPKIIPNNSQESTIPDFPMSGRRMYHNLSDDRKKSVTQTAPFFLDDTLDRLKQRRQGGRIRSSSAPAISRRVQSPEINVNYRQSNLRNALLRKSQSQSPEEPPVQKSTQIIHNRFLADDISDLLNIHKKYQQVATSPSKKKNCISKRGTAYHNQNNSRQVLPTGILENAVVSDVAGRIGILRHSLRQQDQSKSGLISIVEFKTALSKVGVHLDSEQMTDLFTDLSKDTRPYATSTNWYNSGKYIDVESFVERIKSRTESPAFSHLTGRNTANDFSSVSRQTEDARVMKKVLHAANMSSDPTKTFNDISNQKDNIGIEINQLQESLGRLGANLTNYEFNSLMKNIETNLTNENRISIDQFNHLVQKKVNEFDQRGREVRKSHLKNNKYSPSFSSSQVDYLFGNSEFSDMSNSSQTFKSNKKQWERLQNRLQCDSEKVLKAFIGKERNVPERRNEEVPFTKLKNNLINEGVFLANEGLFHSIIINNDLYFNK